ncbi:hypothetical protein [Nocardioides jishulii]|uniref:Uncharacterized protein n=1 Tax=Nocardioides jishulii TaxID=2575440 RepID=A0A4U2YS87_9ACTN|nr:hypothetical protein [Nocardioides jishulii]QCX26208.1 hypothetical protein FCL41_00630 [Nocardioides jishulii]TKI63990.1 hypothetical protein FC770_02075 [Nocardioides jishulii]
MTASRGAGYLAVIAAPGGWLGARGETYVRGIHTIVGAVAVALLATGLLTGCADQEADASTTPQSVAVGVLLHDDEPAEGIELELLVRPSPQAGSGGPDAEAELLRVATDTTDAEGAFDLRVPAGDLSPHASGDGIVGLEIRRVGGEPWSVTTTVRLVRSPETGVTRVEAADRMRLNL